MPHTPFRGAVPDDRLYDPHSDMWVQPDGEALRIGITAFGVFLAGEIVAFTGKPKGAEVAKGRGLGTVESAKTVHALHAPCSFFLLEVNEALEERPAPINRNPYDAWLVRGQARDWKGEVAMLVDAGAYIAHIRSLDPEAVIV